MSPLGLIQVLFVSLVLFPRAGTATKITYEEDLARSVTCGKVVQTKLFEGTEIAGSEAPWMVTVDYPYLNPQASFGCRSGSLISQRHVVTSSDAFLDYGQSEAKDTFRWRSNLTYADMSTCKGRLMPIPQFVLNAVIVYPCAAEPSGSDCRSATKMKVKSGHYMGNCDISKISYGIAVLELEEPLGPAAVPMCINAERGQVGDEVSMYATGTVGDKDAMATKMSKTVECTDATRHIELSVCLNTGACGFDEGGPISRKINGQKYALGVIWSGQCSVGAAVHHASVAVFYTEICETTGVCLTAPTLPTTTPAPTTPAPTTPAPTQPPAPKTEAPDVPIEAASERGTIESSAALKLLYQIALVSVLIFFL